MVKNIVICIDGTSSDVICDSTNVLRLFRCLLRSEHQTVYYDSGVGTVTDPSKITWISKTISRKLDSAIGHSVRDNVCRAYQFLVRAYEPGDRIYLFGFSRGAYAVRALAGMVHFLGLVQPELTGLDRLAWTVYADDHQNLPISKRFEAGHRFKRSFTRPEPVRIHFVGVWETVSAFGWMWNCAPFPSRPAIHRSITCATPWRSMSAVPLSNPTCFERPRPNSTSAFKSSGSRARMAMSVAVIPSRWVGYRRSPCNGCSKKRRSRLLVRSSPRR